MPKHSPKMLLHGGSCVVPKEIAICPECSGRLCAESGEWVSESGLPTIGSLHIFCQRELLKNDSAHQGLFPEWNPVVNKVETWANCVKN